MILCANSRQPWNSTIPTLILLPNCKTQTDINQIHARLLTTGFIKNTYLTTKLILNFCSSPYTPLIQFARYLFFSQPTYRNARNWSHPFLWNAIIKTFSHGNDDPKQAVAILSLMLENGVCVDNFTFSLVLKGCARMGLIEEGVQVHGLLSKFGYGSNLFLQNCLIRLYAKCGLVMFARQVFDKMLEWDSVSFNSMIDGYVKCGMMTQASELFDSMPMDLRNLITWNSMIRGYGLMEDGVKFAREMFEKMPKRDLVSWNLMIGCCVKCGDMDMARSLFDAMPERDVVTWTSMIDGYGKSGFIDIARGLFDEMPVRDVVSCNVMMDGYVQNKRFMEALTIFQNLSSECKLSPDNTTLLIALCAIAQLGHIDAGMELHLYIEENGFLLDGKLGVALIDMYAKSGSIENAMGVFESTEKKTVDHWNAMIGGLAAHGLGQLAFDLFMEMERLSIKPDDITFIGVLNACAHSGLVKEGIMCFEIMRRIHMVEPKLQHYGCIIDIFCRAEHVKEAIRIIEEMPVEPNDVIWRSLLSACKNHENISLADGLANYVISMDYNSGFSRLPSNIYASFGICEVDGRVRTNMKEIERNNVPVCSSIELQRTSYDFLGGYNYNPQVGNREIVCLPQSLKPTSVSLRLRRKKILVYGKGMKRKRDHKQPRT